MSRLRACVGVVPSILDGETNDDDTLFDVKQNYCTAPGKQFFCLPIDGRGGCGSGWDWAETAAAGRAHTMDAVLWVDGRPGWLDLDQKIAHE